MAARPTGGVADRRSGAARAPVVVAEPAVVGLGRPASITVHGFAGHRLQMRLAGATTAGGRPLGWEPLHLAGAIWRGRAPKPALRGVYPIELRSGAGRPVIRSATWLIRVFALGTLARPAFATAEDVARWWVRALPEHARLVALKRWRRPAFDHRDRRLHQLLVVAYSPAGHPRVRDRLGMFITAVRDGYNGRWRLLEATVAP
jgi:hypothetical protein